MAVRRLVYAVDGWGVGELYLAGRVVLAHELPCERLAAPRRTGKPRPVTVAERRAQLCDDFVSTLHVGLPPAICADVCEEVRAASAGSDDRGGAGRGDERDADELATEIAARVRAHLSGRETSYADVPLDLSWCTAFQAAIAGALCTVPWGEIVTYGELAALAGCHGASRAAGTFCARNRFALFLPCHRVVAAAGIGGYGASGVALKRRLLALEGVHL